MRTLKPVRSLAVLLIALLVIVAPLRAMILLTATTSSVEVVLSGAVSSTQLPWTSSYADITTTTFTPGASNGATNSATPVTIVGAPAASTQRQVKFLSVYNADSATATVTIQYNANGTLRIITTIALPVGYTLTYTDGHGFTVLDTTGAIQSSSSGSSAPIDAQYWTGAANATLTAEKNLGGLATGLVLNTAGVPTAYAGTSCTNQFPRSLSASGAASCASVALAADVSGDLPFSSLAQGSALSVLGVTGNVTADHASIVAASDFQVLRRSGTAVAFGAVNLASSAAVTGTLPAANGGTDNTAATDDRVLIGNGSTFDLKAVPDCTDTGGNHLNYTAASNALSCGTSGGGAATYTLLKANSGTDATAAATTLDSYAMASGLTSKDRIVVNIELFSQTAGTALPVIYHATDSISLTNLNNGNGLTAGQFYTATIWLGQDQSSTTIVHAFYSGMGSATIDTQSNGVSSGKANQVSTAYTGNWSLGLRTGAGGVTASGTLHWAWAVWKVAGQ